MQNSKRLWISTLILGIAFDFLFWKKAPGISFAIYVGLCLIAGFLLLRLEGFRPARRSLWLLLPIIFFSLMTFVREEPLTLLLNHAFTLFLLALLALTYLGGRWLAYSMSDYVSGFFHLAGSMLSRPFGLIIERRRIDKEAGKEGSGRQVWTILRGLLIALPVVVIFAALLSSADLIFAQRLDDFVTLFRLEKLPEYLFRGAYILVGAYLLAGVFLHAASRSQDDKLLGMDKPLFTPFLSFTETAIVLGSVILLFLTFVVIQFQYFFGGQANITLEGYTYSEYARRGFGELVTVAFFSLLLFLGLSTITRRISIWQQKVFSGTGIGLVVLVLVMMISAYQRLVLYEAAYGFSRLRTYPHIFMIWLGVLLVAVVLLEVMRRQRSFANAVLLAAMGFIVSLNLLNVDAFIVHQNVARASHGDVLDVPYLASLSADAVPILAKEYRSITIPSDARDQVGAVLACRMASQDEQTNQYQSWQSFHYSRWNAERVMQKVKIFLTHYQSNRDDSSLLKVVSPAGKEYQCWEYGYMD